MRLICGMVLLSAVACAPVFAGDKEKPKAAKPVVVSKESKLVEVKINKEKVKKSGNAFTRFWTDDVGNTIYRGLKKGSNKIANTFD